jgi:hypothetical protein
MLLFRSIALLCAAVSIALGVSERATAGYLVSDVQGGNSGPVHVMSPPPRPTPKPTPKPKPIPAPWNVHPVQSKHDCASALALLATICDAAVKSGELQLLWNDKATALDGYKIYRVDGGRHAVVTTTTNGATPKYGVVSRPNGGYKGACYAVTAYQGARESAQSSRYCVQSGSTASTETFSPAHVRSYVTVSNPGIVDLNNNNATLPLSTLLSWLHKSGFDTLIPSQVADSGHASSVNGTAYVGYQYAFVHETVPTGGEFYSGTDHGWVKIASRGGYDFNLSKLANRKIYSATLTLNVSQTVRDASSHTRFATSDYSCADLYWLGKDFWWSQSGPLNNVIAGGKLSMQPGPSVTVDMTPVVANWAAAGDQRDYGFILSNSIADVNASTPYADLACFTKYYNAQLKVIYF